MILPRWFVFPFTAGKRVTGDLNEGYCATLTSTRVLLAAGIFALVHGLVHGPLYHQSTGTPLMDWTPVPRGLGLDSSDLKAASQQPVAAARPRFSAVLQRLALQLCCCW